MTDRLRRLLRLIPRQSSLQLIVAGALLACAMAPAAPPAVAPADQQRAGPAAAQGPAVSQRPAGGQALYTNPVLDRDFPDPSALRVGETYYVYATNSGGRNVQVARSTDLVHWELLPDPLPALPSWAQAGRTWAPSAAAAGEGYVLYFTARDAASGRQCIGVATAGAPDGPFRSTADAPLICQVDMGGSIDPDAFLDDDGTRYLLWKSDGNCCGLDTWIYIQQVSSDGLSLQGEPVQLIRGDEAWEGFLVEGPVLWRRGDTYYLFYSANRYTSPDYGVGYAAAAGPYGPYEKHGEPILATSSEHGPVIGPGGQDVVEARDGRTWMLYHAWDPATHRYRALHIDELVWTDAGPVVNGPTREPRPAP